VATRLVRRFLDSENAATTIRDRVVALEAAGAVGSDSRPECCKVDVSGELFNWVKVDFVLFC